MRNVKRKISWLLAIAMVLATLNIGGISASRVEAAIYDGDTVYREDLKVNDIIRKGEKVTTKNDDTVSIAVANDANPNWYDQRDWVVKGDYGGHMHDYDSFEADDDYYVIMLGYDNCYLLWLAKAKEIDDKNIYLDQTEFVYKGTKQAPKVMYKEDGKDAVELEQGVDYSVAEGGTAESLNSGEFKFTVVGNGRYFGEVELEWEMASIPVVVTPDDDQSKVYGEDTPKLTYTVSAVNEGDILPAVDFQDGMFVDGDLSYDGKEDAGEHNFTLGTLQEDGNNPSYDITLADGKTFEIKRKQLTDKDISVDALDYDDESEDNGFEYIYSGKNITPTFEVYDSDEKLTESKDYVISGDTSAKNPKDEPNVVNFRGVGNYQGNITAKWNVIKNNFYVVAEAYTGQYDGKEHKAIEVYPSPESKYAGETKKIQYILIKDFDSDTASSIYAKPEQAWEDYSDKATETAPMIKDINRGEDGRNKDYIVLYKVQMNGYEDVIGVKFPLITPKKVTLTVEDASKVYDNDPETDPEFKIEDPSDQMAEGDSINGLKLTRKAGQNVGKYEISVENLDELPSLNPNYVFEENEGTFEIKKRNVGASIGDYEWTYSDEPLDIVPDVDVAGTEGVPEDEGILPGDVDKVKCNLKFVGETTLYSVSRLTDAGEYEIVVSNDYPYKNYKFVTKKSGHLTIHRKSIETGTENVEVVFDGKTDANASEYEFTGSKIEPNIVLRDFIDETNYMTGGKETEGGPEKPDYRFVGTESATDIGIYTITVEGLNNYCGERQIVWSISPFNQESEKVYNGEKQSPDFMGDFDPKKYENFFTIEFSKNGTNYSSEIPTFKDVLRDKNGNVNPYTIYYRITFNPDEYGPDPQTGEARKAEGRIAFTITPAPLSLKDVYVEKEYDGTPTVSFEKKEVGGIGQDKLAVSFDATLEFADSDDALKLGDDPRPLKVTEEQEKAAIIVPTNNSGANPDNYEAAFPTDDDGFVIGIGANVSRKTLYDKNSEKCDGESYISGTGIDRAYDGTTMIEAEIEVVTGIDGEEISFSDAFGEVKDADVILDDEGCPGAQFVSVTGVAEGNDNTDLANYRYFSETEAAYYNLDETMPDEEDDTWVGSIDTSVTILPRNVTLKAEDATKKVGEDDPELKYTVDGVVEGETLKNIKIARAAGETEGIYDITVSCDADPNYAITFVKGKFTITSEKEDGGDDQDDQGGQDGQDGQDGKSDQDGKDDKPAYSSEWVNGKWYDADGKQTYKGTMSWKQNEKGWWIEDSEGWYPKSEWQKIDGKWYYFTADGYMDYSEYRDGCWLGADGAWVEEYYGGHWMQDSTGWWYTDGSGWYPVSQWLWIDGVNYYFKADGYMQ